MNWKNLPLGWKLGVGFGVVLALAALSSFIAFRGMTDVHADFEELSEHEVTGLRQAAQAQSAFLKMRISLYQLLAQKNPAERAKRIQEWKGHKKELEDTIGAYKTDEVKDENDKNMNRAIQAVKDAWKVYDGNARDFLPPIERGELEAAAAIVAKGARPTAENLMLPALASLMDTYVKAVEVQVAETDRSIQTTDRSIILLLLATLGFGIAAAWWTTRAVVGPLAQLSDGLRKLESEGLRSLSDGLRAMADGDFTKTSHCSVTPLPSVSGDEIGKTCEVFNSMLQRTLGSIEDANNARTSLGELVTGIQASAQAVWSDDVRGGRSGISDSIRQVSATIGESAHTAQEMANGSESLAMTASQAAANVEEMDRSIEEMSRLAQKVLDEATSTRTDAAQGEESLGRLVESLDKISQRSGASMEAVLKLGEQQEKIGAIVKTIEEISDQTNLLALNAAIEAARAGEHGRGFAVVAEEVRKLAERAGSSTKEIEALISSVKESVDATHREMTASVEAVEEGQSVGKQAAEVLVRIAQAAGSVQKLSEKAQHQSTTLADRARDVSSLVSQVASISEESAAGSQEISAGLHEIAASATTVSTDLGAIASELNSQVSRFRVAA